MRWLPTASLACLLGCAGPLRVSAFVESSGELAARTELPTYVADACRILELECEASRNRRGSITLVLFPPPRGGIRGRAFRPSVCHRIAWSEEGSAHVAAHEFGHLLGLGHVDDPRNLMHPSADGNELTAEQRARVLRSAALLRACRP